jgi:iron-sulfur cluster repair protein YtfE (RIC family)
MNQSQQRQLLEAFAREQGAVHEKIAQWREWCRELCEMGDPRFGEMGTRLEQIRNDLSAHFNHEEQCGCMGEVVAAHPELAGRVTQIETQHEQLLNDLNEMIARLESEEPAYASWGEARTAFESFLNRLEEHECAESAVLEQWNPA